MSYPVETYERLAGEAREIIARYPQGHARSALLPMLHLVQSEDGYVSANGIALCAELLGITRAEVSAVATESCAGHLMCGSETITGWPSVSSRRRRTCSTMRRDW